ncbi:MAG: molybdopterin biosynthesis protein [Armatimonadetes bacterium]|nr:molybdopterin biosynthesis protein [Armatimonadota bacterium]
MSDSSRPQGDHDPCCAPGHHERRRYLRKTSLADALAAWLGHPACHREMEAETLPTPQARGRVTAAPVYARRSVPHYHCAAMDGIAVRAADTFGASETDPRRIPPTDYTVVDTGDPLPEERDAVVMIEHVRWLPDGSAELIEPAAPWHHVRLAGEDLVATEMVLPSGHILRPADVAALLSCGVTDVPVRRRPRVAILPTGDELVDPYAPDEARDLPGAIPETNSYLIGGLVEEWGGEALRVAPLPDRPEAICNALRCALAEADVVCINAGSSAGREDFVPRILEEEGELLVHGVDIMPGKPTALAVVADRPVLGVPGYPVSAWVVCEEFLRPLLCRMLGLAPLPIPTTSGGRVPAVMGRKAPSHMGNDEYVRVKAGRVGERLVVVPLPRGASLLNSVVRADGVVRIPAHLEGVEAGETVALEPLRPLAAIEASLLAIGSHDLLLDLLSDFLGRRHPGAGLSSAHVGSLAGLVALRRGECHLAGTHLIDEATGEYNLSWVRRFFPEGEVALVNLAWREQGLIVPRGNPHGLRGLAHLAEKQVPFVNRQRGSGTRQLLDYELQRLGIRPEQIRGYDRELYTHLAVASAVQTGAAEAGLGILAAARALDLDFLPIAAERYDLAIRPDVLDLPAMRALLAILSDPEFRTQVEALGGYDLRDAGRRWL